MRSDAHFGVRFVWAIVLGAQLCPTGTAWAAPGDFDDDTVSDTDEDLDHNGDPTNDDTDDDGVPNGLDPDDDGDGVLTKREDTDGDGDPTNDFTDIEGREQGADYLNFNVPVDRDHDTYIAVAYGGDDCDDLRVGVHPGVDHDPLYDGEDWDCDGGEFEFDGDGDGYDSQVESTDGDDCNDYDPTVHPGAIEGSEPAGVDVDMDCDGWTDTVGTLVPNGGCDCDTSDGPLGLILTVGAGLAARSRRRGR